MRFNLSTRNGTNRRVLPGARTLVRFRPGGWRCLIISTPLDSRNFKRTEIQAPLRAFTLIEMMVVLVLIGILSAMVIPEMKGTFEDALLRSTARELVDVTQLASSRAISLNQTLRLDLDPVSCRYQVERLKREGLVEDFVPLKDVPHSAGQLDKRIAIEIHSADEMTSAPAEPDDQSHGNQATALAFNPDGTADNALILLKDRAGFRLALRINPITSRVTITEAPHE